MEKLWADERENGASTNKKFYLSIGEANCYRPTTLATVSPQVALPPDLIDLAVLGSTIVFAQEYSFSFNSSIDLHSAVPVRLLERCPLRLQLHCTSSFAWRHHNVSIAPSEEEVHASFALKQR